ncbi:hypothetical protein GN958_ATG02691 [Phytophthora infestans]|uniref:Uncharacterized protein n=1 Tax=Phytophthora infestans TaxID=4787 RepID=A0A8S9V9N2_PHYIN|nr:hypothetical protein GN958_ATG02691 [Phytophthora infestans]
MSLPTTYNVRNNKAALVGNWVEEEALRDKTDHDRRKVPAPYLAPGKPKGVSDRADIRACPPQDHATSVRNYTPSEPPGLHSEQRAREREEQQLDCHEVALTTIATSNLPVNTYALVKERIPRGRNGSLARQVDPNIQHLTKAQTDSIDQMKLDLVQSTTVTRYSYAVNPWLELCRDCLGGRNAFGQPSTFTNELNDPTKRHGEATEPGAIHDERIGATTFAG